MNDFVAVRSLNGFLRRLLNRKIISCMTQTTFSKNNHNSTSALLVNYKVNQLGHLNTIFVRLFTTL